MMFVRFLAAAAVSVTFMAGAAYAGTPRTLPTLPGMVTLYNSGGVTIQTNNPAALTGVSATWNTGSTTGSYPAPVSTSSVVIGK